MNEIRHIFTPEHLETVNLYFNKVAEKNDGLPRSAELMKNRIDLVASLQSAARDAPLSTEDAIVLRDNERRAYNDMLRLTVAMRFADKQSPETPKEDFERPGRHRFYGDNHTIRGPSRGR
jgi:hypothetical protein